MNDICNNNNHHHDRVAWKIHLKCLFFLVSRARSLELHQPDLEAPGVEMPCLAYSHHPLEGPNNP